MTTIKRWLRRILLGFVLITVGFSLGRQTTPLPEALPNAFPQTHEIEAQADEDRLTVYAAHATQRCFSCTLIEQYARELLDLEFGELQNAGRIDLQAIDYAKNTPFARQYNIASSTLILVRQEDGQEREFVRLDDVWTHLNNRDAFMNYVRNAIYAQLDILDRRTP